MFNADYSKRRAALRAQVGSGLIILPGNNDAPCNYPDNPYKFRQDSTFLYYFGLNMPGVCGIIDADSGEEYLFGDDVTMDDIIWMGPQPAMKELAASVGVAHSVPRAAMKGVVDEARKQRRVLHFLPPYRGDILLLLEELTGIPAAGIPAAASMCLTKAVIAMRSVKEPGEIEEIERACDIGYEMHTAAMRLCRPGVTEQYVCGQIEGIAASYGKMISFPVILSQHGETLHNHYHGNVLEAGRLMLTDAGAEVESGYCSDFTRTVPVSGRFTTRQREVYDVVVACHERAIDFARPGVTWREVHLNVCKVLARGLKDLGLMKGDVEEAVAAGAHALFMPHGLGHMMGLDVHDMENLGQVYVGFDEEVRPSDQFGLASLRLGRRLQEGFVMTDEPGCYFIPALIDQWRAAGLHKDFLNYEVIETYKGFGGIRLEDDLLITADGSRFLGKKRIPLTGEEVEAIMNE